MANRAYFFVPYSNCIQLNSDIRIAAFVNAPYKPRPAGLPARAGLVGFMRNLEGIARKLQVNMLPTATNGLFADPARRQGGVRRPDIQTFTPPRAGAHDAPMPPEGEMRFGDAPTTQTFESRFRAERQHSNETPKERGLLGTRTKGVCWGPEQTPRPPRAESYGIIWNNLVQPRCG